MADDEKKESGWGKAAAGEARGWFDALVDVLGGGGSSSSSKSESNESKSCDCKKKC